MGADTFICGECQMTFHDINAFLKHKNTNCQNKQKVMVCKVDDAAQDETQTEQEEVEEEIDVEGTTGDDETQTVLQMVDGSGEHQTIQIVESTDQAVHFVDPSGQEFELLEASQDGHQIHLVETTGEDGGQHFQIMDEDGNLIATPGGTVQVVKLTTESDQRAALMGTKANGSIVQPKTLVPGIEFIPVVETDIGKDGKNNWKKDGNAQQSTIIHRKRGRPRKGMERLLPPEPKKEPAIKEEKPKEPVKGKDGKLACPKCKKTFGRMRHFTTHRCLATGDYGILSDDEEVEEKECDRTPDYKPAQRDVEEVEADEKEESSTQSEAEKKHTPRKSPAGKEISPFLKKGRGRPAKIYRLRAPDGKLYDDTEGNLFDGQSLLPLNLPGSIAVKKLPDDTSKEQCEIEPKGVVMADPLSNDGDLRKLKSDTTKEAKQSDVTDLIPASTDQEEAKQDAPEHGQDMGVQDSVITAEQKTVTDEEMVFVPPTGEENPLQKLLLTSDAITKDMIPDLPVFTTEEEKITFEESLNQIDMTQCDNLFSVHVIQQDVNENAPVNISRVSNELNVYTCTVCDKVFKMLSHVRNHVLGHTDLKPFACRLCEYASNNKGNLYTHMRRHTGQLYRCPSCSFTTCNKTHLMEHIRTHRRNKQTCRMCSKKYTTEKSLMNHIRKYHRGQKGQNYLNEFQGKQHKGPTVLHQCHICNRKFKKKTDRDRHLFVHNIKENDNIHQCDLCNYTASKRIYLEKHFRRHRVVYVCCECKQKFSSTIQLSNHLNEAHACGDLDDTWLDMFTKCIEVSLFQPEPEAPIRTVAAVKQTAAGTELDITPETNLSAGLHKGSTENARASELLRQIMRSTIGSKNEDIESESEVDVLSVDKKSTESDDKPVNAQSEEGEKETSSEGTVYEITQNIDDGEIEENEEESNSEAAKALEKKSNYDIYKRLEFVTMTMDIFHRLRQAFGNEECEYCGRLYYSRSDCQQHVKTHTGDRPFHCDQCNYRSITKDQLKRHIEREHENIKYVCHQCEYVAPSRTNLWHHQQKHKKPQALACPICPEKFDSAKRLKIHMEFKHPEIPSTEAAKIASANHKTNGKLGRKSFRCPYCDRQFVRGSSELQKHIWIHEGIKPFKCPLCPYACRSKSNLTNHLLRHSSEKPFLCIHCGKAYKSKTALRWHVRTHKDGKIFKCTKCEYEATQKSHLVRHLETHNVIKRFQCQHCDYSANTLGYIKIHYTRMHEGCTYTHNPEATNQQPVNSETKVYKCLSCDYLFGNLCDMKRHLKIRHHVQVDNLQLLEEDTSQMTQVVADEEPSLTMQVNEENIASTSGDSVQAADAVPTAEADATSALQALQYAVPPRTFNERTVDVLQQLLGLSQQGAAGGNQPITVQANDGQLLELNPGTIIVQQNPNGEVVLTSSDPNDVQQGQYVIQYIEEDQTVTEQQVENIVHMTSHEQVSVQTIVQEEDIQNEEQLQIVSESQEDAGSVKIIHDADGGTKVVRVISQTPTKGQEQNVSTEEVPMEVGE